MNFLVRNWINSVFIATNKDFGEDWNVKDVKWKLDMLKLTQNLVFNL